MGRAAIRVIREQIRVVLTACPSPPQSERIHYNIRGWFPELWYPASTQEMRALSVAEVGARKKGGTAINDEERRVVEPARETT